MELFRHKSTICITAFLFSTLGAEVLDPPADSQYRLPNIHVREAGTVPAGLTPGRQTLSREQIAEQPLGDRLRGSGGLRYQNHQRFGGEWLPAAGLHYDATESGSLRLYAGKGHRSPSLAEQFIVPPANEALRAERLTHYEISWEHRFTETLEADLTVFYQDFENLIAPESLTGDGRPPFLF